METNASVKSPFPSLKRCDGVTASLHRRVRLCTTCGFEVLTSPIVVSHFSDRAGANVGRTRAEYRTSGPCMTATALPEVVNY
jgi:hypothetical protein